MDGAALSHYVECAQLALRNTALDPSWRPRVEIGLKHARGRGRQGSRGGGDRARGGSPGAPARAAAGEGQEGGAAEAAAPAP